MTTADLDLYMRRIGLDALPGSGPQALAAIQLAHRRSIGFENLDIRLGYGVSLDPGHVFDKIVRRGRGGYCFEQNGLYARMLHSLGFPNRPLLARVRLGMVDDHVPARTHVLLLVDINGEDWIADAGFGGSYLPPMHLVDGAQGETPDGARHRLSRGKGEWDGAWMLERAGPHGATDGRCAPHESWQAQYTFEMTPVAGDDLEMCNHWTSTRPGTRFTSFHIASLALADGFASLNERTLSIHSGGNTSTRSLDDPKAYREALAEVLNIELSIEDARRLPLFAA